MAAPPVKNQYSPGEDWGILMMQISWKIGERKNDQIWKNSSRASEAPERRWGEQTLLASTAKSWPSPRQALLAARIKIMIMLEVQQEMQALQRQPRYSSTMSRLMTTPPRARSTIDAAPASRPTNRPYLLHCHPQSYRSPQAHMQVHPPPRYRRSLIMRTHVIGTH